jgi:hypothetical protein
MKRVSLLLVLILCGAAAALQAEDNRPFSGTALKMRMTQCIVGSGFKASMAGKPASVGSCPEYTVLGPTVVYVMVGRRTESFIPLSEKVEFVVRNNEIVINNKSKLRFVIEQMTLRSDWEREEERKEMMTTGLERGTTDEQRNLPRETMFAAAK